MKYVIPIIVGAVIGYITNWLAIKMLFRPHYEKRFFGIKIPFTPGLIPKERDRIAKSIGDTIGTHLLTSDMLVEALCSDKVKKHVGSWLKDRILRVKESRITLGQWLNKVNVDIADTLQVKIEKTLAKIIIEQLRREELKEVALDILDREVFEGSENIHEIKLYNLLKKKIQQVIYNLLNSADFKDEIGIFLQKKFSEFKNDTRPLVEVVPKTWVDSLKIYLYNNSEEIAKFIKDSLENENVRDRIKSAVFKVVEDNLGKLVTMFISPEVIGRKVIDAIERYMDNPQNQSNIVFIIINFINRIMSKSVSEILSGISSDAGRNGSAEIAEMMADYLRNPENTNAVFDLIENKIISTQGGFRNVFMDNAGKFIMDVVGSEKFEKVVYSFVHNTIIENLINKPLYLIMEVVDISSMDVIIKYFEDVYEGLVRSNAHQVVELIDISSIVEKRINSFDVAFAEKIILDVASRELSAITWLGALLGGIMGILSPLLQSLYN